MNARRALIVLASVGAVGAATFFVGIRFIAREVVLAAEEPREPKDGNYEPVARDLALLAQTLDEPLTGLGHAWLPKRARELHPQMARVDRDGAELSWGRDYGGSLTLRREQPDAGGERSTWVLTRYSRQHDGAKNGVVARVSLRRGERRAMDDFIGETQAAYAAAIDKKLDSYTDHFSRVQFALRFQSREAARALLVDSTGRAPEDPDPRMGLALFDAADGRDDGIRNLEAWAAAKPTFARYSDVALVHATLGRVDPALEAVARAVEHPLKVDGWYMHHATARSLPLLKLALVAQRYDRVEALAEHVGKHEPDPSAKAKYERDLRAIRAAAAFLRGDRARARDLVQDGLIEPDAFYRGPDEEKRAALAVAIRAGDETHVRAWQPPDAGIVAFLLGEDTLARIMRRNASPGAVDAGAP